MKTNHTDEEIQAAIDEACRQTGEIHRAITGSTIWLSGERLPDIWKDEQPARLHLLKSALDLLPEPPPPVVDGKTPGQVAFEASEAEYQKGRKGKFQLWEEVGDSCKAEWERRASAVLAAFGNKPASLPAETPWIEWHGGECPLKMEHVRTWECKMRDGRINTSITTNPENWRWKHIDNFSDIIAYRVLKWREGFGPAVDWRVRYDAADIAAKDSANAAREQFRRADAAESRAEKAEADLLSWKGNAERLSQDHAELSKELADAKKILQQVDLPDEPLVVQAQRMKNQYEWQAGIARGYEKQIQRANEILSQPQLSTLRPIGEAGPVPAAAVRVYGYYSAQEERWVLTTWQDTRDTHFADILLPAVESEKPDPYAELKAAHAAGKVIEVFVKDDEYGPDRWSKKENNSWTLPPDCYRIKPAETFETYGKTWTQMVDRAPPCEAHSLVNVLCAGDDEYRANILCKANDVTWTDQAIIGWRYADEPTPEEPVKPWTPAVGDVVRLVSGGPKMVVRCFTPENAVVCDWFRDDEKDSAVFPAATLQLA